MTHATDRRNVNGSGGTNPGGIDEVLSSLPQGYIVATQGDARLVLGPTGAFVLLPAGRITDDVAATAHRLAHLVLVTRNALCDHLTWVPFLDALLVTSADPPRDVDVTVVPHDLVRDVLIEGPTVITLGTLNSIREALRSTRIDGWQIGTGAPGANINLRDPAQPSATR